MTQMPSMSTFSTRRYPLGLSFFLYPLVDLTHPKRIGNSPNLLRLAFSTNSSRLILNVSSFIVHGGSFALFGTSILPRLKISPMRLRRLGLYAKPVPSIAMAVMLHKAIKEKETRGKEMTRRSLTGKHLQTEQVTRKEGIPLRPKRPQSTHLFFPTPPSPSSPSCSSFALPPIFKTRSSWSRREF